MKYFPQHKTGHQMLSRLGYFSDKSRGFRRSVGDVSSRREFHAFVTDEGFGECIDLHFDYNFQPHIHNGQIRKEKEHDSVKNSDSIHKEIELYSLIDLPDNPFLRFFAILTIKTSIKKQHKHKNK